ncbi:hypothetical protein G6F31_019774 [Rhizopus arrhizus]|nr:hypothetical protein G6F31_019774 [Rhizopus arrhizus]
MSPLPLNRPNACSRAMTCTVSADSQPAACSSAPARGHSAVASPVNAAESDSSETKPRRPSTSALRSKRVTSRKVCVGVCSNSLLAASTPAARRISSAPTPANAT